MPFLTVCKYSWLNWNLLCSIETEMSSAGEQLIRDKLNRRKWEEGVRLANVFLFIHFPSSIPSKTHIMLRIHLVYNSSRLHAVVLHCNPLSMAWLPSKHDVVKRTCLHQECLHDKFGWIVQRLHFAVVFRCLILCWG